MRNARILGGAIVAILGISGVALASGVVGADSDTGPTVSSPSVSAAADAAAAGTASLAIETAPMTADVPPSTSGGTSPTTTGETSTTSDASSSTTTDDHPSTTTSSPPTTQADSDDGSSVSLRHSTHTVADAGTVTVDGMTLVEVDANAGWQAEIDEASSDRIEIEFDNGEQQVDFELHADGELRIKSRD